MHNKKKARKKEKLRSYKIKEEKNKKDSLLMLQPIFCEFLL